MKQTDKPFRATLVYGLICGLTYPPLSFLLSRAVAPPLVAQLLPSLYLAGYALLLAGWSRTPPTRILWPLLLPAALIFVVPGPLGLKLYSFGALAALAWIRSGICFTQPPHRLILAELLLTGGGASLITIFAPHTTVSFALAVWLFFLIQSLYFPLFPGKEQPAAACCRDPFEEAERQLDRILSTGNG